MNGESKINNESINVKSKIKVELNTELENDSYKVQVKELELDGRYLFVRGIVLDAQAKEAFEFEDSVDLSDFCWDETCGEQEINDEQETSTSVEV
jgi:uncharacterized protein YdeI (BOF family)